MDDMFIRGLVPGAIIGLLIALYFLMSKSGYRAMMRMQIRFSGRRKALAETSLPALEGGLDTHKMHLEEHLEGSGYIRLDVGRHEKPGKMLFSDKNKLFGPQYSYELEETAEGIHVALKQITGHLQKGKPERLDTFVALIQPGERRTNASEAFEDLS